ncbi:MAG: hypothetical protein WDN49_26280 [Acetobacteraceae bacterium]
MVSVLGGGDYKARVARIQCGDPQPRRPPATVRRRCRARWTGRMPAWSSRSPSGPGWMSPRSTWVRPSRRSGSWPRSGRPLVAREEQTVLGWAGPDSALTLGVGPRGAYCRLITPGGTTELRTNVALTERAWHDVACTFDPLRGVLSLGQAPRKTRLDRVEAAQASCAIPPGTRLAGPGAASIARGTAARRGGGALQRQDRAALHRGRVGRPGRPPAAPGGWRPGGAHPCGVGPRAWHRYRRRRRYRTRRLARTLSQPADAGDDRLELDRRRAALDRGAPPVRRDPFP